MPTVTTAYQQHVPVTNNVAFDLLAFNQLQESIITEHNPILWSLFYTDDYMMFYSATPIINGRKEIDNFLQEHTKHLPIFEKLDIRNDRIDDLGPYVIEYASHIAIVRNGNWSGVVTGKDIRIWRRSPNSSLRIFRAIAMYD